MFPLYFRMQTKRSKNPQRWKKIQWSVCEKESKNPHDTGFKERILDICDIRQDDWSNEVFLRMQGVQTSLPAYDGRYHKACYDSFIIPP